MQTAALSSRPKSWVSLRQVPGILFDLFLLLLVLTGVVFRFSWVNWNRGAPLHPDEYGLTNTLTQLSLPKSLGDYFNTRVSPISPYQKYDLAGQPADQGPDNRMRWGQWPIILIRAAGEITGGTGYDEIRLLGRRLSALADTLALGVIYLIGRRLYNRRTGLMAAALSALAVMQIQQSHFMTVDNFAVLFTSLSMYAAVRIAQRPPAARVETSSGHYKFEPRAWVWYLLFGVAFGMAMACKVNLLPLGGMLLVAAFIAIADLKLRRRDDLVNITLIAGLLLFLAVFAALLTFRLTQPMTFRAVTGETTVFTLHPNQDWLDSMAVAQSESSGIGGGPPAEQWAHRPAILFPWVNMVLWGMGLPLGLAAWAGFLAAGWELLRHGRSWRAHLLPLVWVGGYFLFMGTRWVKSIRYFLPIYPFLCLFAAWALLALWQRWAARPEGTRHPLRVALACLALAGVLLGTLAWADGFTRAVYRQMHTRLQASQWFFQNVPAPFNVDLDTPDGSFREPIGAPDGMIVASDVPYTQSFVASSSGTLREVTLSHVSPLTSGDVQAKLHIRIALDAEGKFPIDDATVAVDWAHASAPAGSQHATFRHAQLTSGQTYYLIASAEGEHPIQIRRTVLANESWDEGLPMNLNGYDAFGQFYRGETIEARWYDDAKKRAMYLEKLSLVDYVILPSQRAIWSACRIPLTYPMTMEYYRALFDGRLGFEEAAFFNTPFIFGPLQISDVGGTLAWNRAPALPLFNDNVFAAEEAFSIYDHPPVWIFRKSAQFNQESAQKILEAVDLEQVVIQSPREATFPAP